MQRRCDKCEWCYVDSGIHLCRRKSPNNGEEVDVTYKAPLTMRCGMPLWPIVNDDDWCGEFKPKNDCPCGECEPKNEQEKHIWENANKFVELLQKESREIQQKLEDTISQIKKEPKIDVTTISDIERKFARAGIDNKNIEFMECDTCRAKPGSPILCGGCLHNRIVIDALKGVKPVSSR